MRHRLCVSVIFLLGSLVPVAPAYSVQLASPQEHVAKFGAVRVIVEVKPPNERPASLFSFLSTTELAARALPQARLVKPPQTIGPSSFVTTVRPEGLAELQQSPNFSRVYVDTLSEPLLSESIPLIGAPQFWPVSNGRGVAIAILDTGVEAAHQAFGGRVVYEACFSSTVPPAPGQSGSQSLCPNGLEEQKNAGAARPCSIQGCEHGTHVAAIAAGGRVQNEGKVLSGVAPGAQIIAAQVFSRFDDPNLCRGAASCVLSWASDQIRALNHIRDLTLQRRFPIKVVNMSLGGGHFLAPCENEPIRPDVEALREIGVATVIAAGNSGYNDALAAPACLASAISVGATLDTTDQIASGFSNRSPHLHFMAPGDSITAAVPGRGYANMSGTSMAAPHVAGSWALIMARNPGMTVDQVIAVLKRTGVSITDPVTGVSYSRIALNGVQAAAAPGVLGAPAQAAPVRDPPPASADSPALSTPPIRAIITAPAEFNTPQRVRDAVDPNLLQGRPLDVRPLPGTGRRFSITGPSEAIRSLESKGIRIQPDAIRGAQ